MQKKGFQEHIFRLCLDAPLYLATIKFQAEHELGRSYVVLTIYVEGLKALGLIDDATYHHYKQRYMKPLKPNFIVEDNRPKCHSCGKLATYTATFMPTNKTYSFCETCIKNVEKHPKWKVGNEG